MWDLLNVDIAKESLIDYNHLLLVNSSNNMLFMIYFKSTFYMENSELIALRTRLRNTTQKVSVEKISRFFIFGQKPLPSLFSLKPIYQQINIGDTATRQSANKG